MKNSSLLAKAAALWAAMAVMGAAPVRAQSFEEAMQAARRTDAQYAAALAAADARRALSRQAATAYYPSATVNYNSVDLSYSGRVTRSLTVQQPLLSYDRFLLLKQADPLAALSQVDAIQAENDLALRVFTAMADIVRARESIRALDTTINGLQEQLQRARRMRELGQGTVTEVSDFETRVAVAQANRLNQLNNLGTAQRSFSLVTGLRPEVPTLRVEPAQPWPQPPSLEQLTASVRDNAAMPLAARLNVELARIAAKRVTAQYLPQINAQATRLKVAGVDTVDTSRVALTLTAPLGTAPYYDYQRASAELVRAEDNLRYAQDSTVAEATRLHAALSALGEEVKVREQAVASARLAVEANVRSYQGGVKSNIDVITSYQGLSDAEVALATTQLSLAEAALRLNLLLRLEPSRP